MNVSTPASATVFVITYTFIKPPRAGKVPSSVKREIDKVQNEVVILTSDPSGEENYRVAKRLVLGENPYEGNDFRVLVSRRICDAMGVVCVTDWKSLDGKAPEESGVIVESDDDGGEGENDGGSQPPPAMTN